MDCILLDLRGYCITEYKLFCLLWNERTRFYVQPLYCLPVLTQCHVTA
jgi:hypothetical protein